MYPGDDPTVPHGCKPLLRYHGELWAATAPGTIRPRNLNARQLYVGMHAVLAKRRTGRKQDQGVLSAAVAAAEQVRAQLVDPFTLVTHKGSRSSLQ
eukprot:4292962-Karenia_brevis.AAC.1